ncbi:MAG: hypothetical protein AUH42_01185 [Gemmatimonadetes bacterium 13_1_40CM_70_11]|nr:MAG: hypothetical protein AUH42_01185 [Gemmatimonadetes bacterium 13_1_40CM_70_11]
MHLAHPRRWLLALYVVSALLVTIQQVAWHRHNNFDVFRAASANLVAGRDLYAAHPDQHFDYYKYSPSFAALFLPFAELPLAAALFTWNALNALLLCFALARLLPQRQANLALALVYVEALLAMQYAQSNSLVAALMILAFVALEEGKQLGAALATALGACIKLFPLAALALAAFHPRKLRYGVTFAVVLGALAALPLVLVPPHQLVAQYGSWRAIEALDTLNRGYSVMQYLYQWLGADWPTWPVQLAGTAVFLLPLVRGPACRGDPDFRRLFLCSLLVYVLLFNHQSERATFVIAFAGVCIWYVSSPPSRLRTTLLLVTLLVMVLHDVDVVPRWVKSDVLIPYRVKGIPYLVVWAVMQAELWGFRGWRTWRAAGPPGTIAT